ncbi:type VII secretion target [Couchioplanes caeruleus]|uniref:Excreted virulence factor EspC (Type VII ESX diderm) n=2 Tax=Couchioplanes caeruleus TaxID=56438 RepID=A0A1K0FK07_9ACTN|nr:type VII secretion target [Couchioplanes caeruleus]OJF13199.1 hypothetical protein BG844_16425 [Couchioplanes caeruleus subsp. caeruleus]ROP27759.1 excreted virulence factor EspC (type VII ESX diderm) [Couchioplanes caeruleus]
MPADDVRFPAAAVEHHAAGVDGIAEAVGRARSAVHEVTMDTQAYGQLCQFLPNLLSPVFALALDALDDAGDTLRDTADNLRAAAADHTATDNATSRRVRTAGGPLLDLPPSDRPPHVPSSLDPPPDLPL